MILKLAKKKLIAIIVSSVVGLGAVGGGIAAIVINANKPDVIPPTVFSVSVSGEAEFGGTKLGDGFSFSVKEESENAGITDWTVPAAALTEGQPTVTYRFTIKNDGGKDAAVRLTRPTAVPEQFGLTAKAGGQALTALEGHDSLTVAAGETLTVEYVLEILVCNKDIPAFSLTFELKIEEKITI